jgi:hypothetical protein
MTAFNAEVETQNETVPGSYGWRLPIGDAKQVGPNARPQERSHCPRNMGQRGAEGATAPETLRQKDCGGKGALESSGGL